MPQAVSTTTLEFDGSAFAAVDAFFDKEDNDIIKRTRNNNPPEGFNLLITLETGTTDLLKTALVLDQPLALPLA